MRGRKLRVVGASGAIVMDSKSVRIIREYDASLLRELRDWCDANVHGDRLHAQVFETMAAFIAANIEMESCASFPNIYDRSGCEQIRRAYDEAKRCE